MSKDFGAGFHVAPGQEVDALAYEAWTGRWSRLFVPAVLAAAQIVPGDCVLDVSTGTGEAALQALPLAGASGVVIGVDISSAMLRGARSRLQAPRFLPVGGDGQALPFAHESFDAVVCHLGLQFFPQPEHGLAEFRRVLRPGKRAAVCVIATPERAPMWGFLADAVAKLRPDLRSVLYLSFALHDAARLEALVAGAGFDNVSVERQTRGAVVGTFEDYWKPIEAGVGSIPQAYLALPNAERHQVREEVRSKLAGYETGGKLRLTVEMLVGVGQAPLST
jgi:ubiquinone/menaquinone biosynthesis C-methylase UbiE